MTTKREKMQALMLAMEENIRNKITEGHSFITLEITQNISNINHLLVQNAVKLETFIKEEMVKAVDKFSDAKEEDKDAISAKTVNVKQEVLSNPSNVWTPRELGLESPNDMYGSGANMDLTNGYY